MAFERQVAQRVAEQGNHPLLCGPLGLGYCAHVVVFPLVLTSVNTPPVQLDELTMLKSNDPAPQPTTPSAQAVRRAVASSVALKTGLSVEQLEQKLKNWNQSRFAHIKLAA